MSYDYTRFGGMDALPTSQSQLESLQRLLAEKQERITALERENAELCRRANSATWRDVEKLVEAARVAYQLNSLHTAEWAALAEALKPFEQEK